MWFRKRRYCPACRTSHTFPADWCVDCGNKHAVDWDRPADEHLAPVIYDGDPLCELCAFGRFEERQEALGDY